MPKSTLVLKKGADENVSDLVMEKYPWKKPLAVMDHYAKRFLVMPIIGQFLNGIRRHFQPVYLG